MFNQACLSDVPDATIGNQSYSAAPRIRYWTTGLMLSDRGHFKDVPLPGKLFQSRTIFELFTAEFYGSDRNLLPESVFGEKQPLIGIGQISKFRYTKGFTSTVFHVFMPRNPHLGSYKTMRDSRISCSATFLTEKY